jgi:hypothetical protein
MPFPHRSPQQSSANAARGGLKPPPAGRLRRAKPSSSVQHHYKTENPTYFRPSRSGHNKAAKLVERFARDAADILRFTTHTVIWFSNNQSERDLRPTKLQFEDQRNLADATRLG